MPSSPIEQFPLIPYRPIKKTILGWYVFDGVGHQVELRTLTDGDEDQNWSRTVQASCAHTKQDALNQYLKERNEQLAELQEDVSRITNLIGQATNLLNRLKED